jgi:ankyrin repeat protein
VDVYLLLVHGANVDFAVKDGRTSLHLAAVKNHVEVVRRLLNYGALVDFADKEGCSALHLSGQQGHLEVVRVAQSWR